VLVLNERLQGWNLRFKEHAHTYMVVLAVLVGLLAGFGAVGFRHLVDALQTLFWSGGMITTEWVSSLPWWQIILAPAIGGLLTGSIVHYGASEAKGHGVPEVMEAVALRGARIRPRVVAVKTLASGICLASGGSVGREGPIVQIGAAIGSTVGQIFQLNTRRMRTIAGCGAAAGIAATFNAPIAGLIFVVEVLLRDLRFTHISPIVVASVVATAVSHEMLEDLPAFVIPHYSMATSLELPVYALLGLLTAVLGAFFIRALYASEDFFERWRVHPGVIAMVGGAGVGAIALQFPEVLGNGYEGIDAALRSAPIWSWFAMLLLAKIAAVCLTLGTGGSGGVFAPSLVMGAMAGGMLGAAMNALFPGSVGPVGAYALVGMGAMVAATTHAPLTAIIILFELTNDYAIILPLMIACILATLLSSRIQPASIYTMKLVRRGVQLHAGKDVNVLRNIAVSDVMRHEFRTLPAGEPLLELLSDIAHDEEPAYFVMDGEDKFLGTLSLHDLRPILGDIDGCKNLISAGDLADASCQPLTAEDTVDTALARLQAQHREVLPVTSQDKIVGAVHMEDILASYRREVFKRDMAQGMVDAFATDEHALRAIGDNLLTEIEAPVRFHGKTLAQLHLRAKHRITILVVKRTVEGEEDVIVPGAETIILPHDQLLVMGREDAVRKLAGE
jgi:CIC family chloride channel protein